MEVLPAKVIVLILLVYGSVSVYSRALNRCPEIRVPCACGEFPNVTIAEFEAKQENVYFETSIQECSHAALTDAVCRSHSCYSPADLINSNHSLSGGSTSPVKFVLPPAGNATEHHGQTRVRRFPKSCNDSLSLLRNTVITCWAWPEFLTCEFRCVHGYALKVDGQSVQKTTRSCRERESYWKPEPNFPICQPYIHCRTSLVGPGEIICMEEMESPSYCDISCESYENLKDVPLKRYECVDEKYAKSLPHCATVDTKAVLIKRPNA